MADVNLKRLKYVPETQLIGTTDLDFGRDYILKDSNTYILPLVSEVPNNTVIRFIKIDEVTPILQVEGTSLEVINLNRTDRQDTAVIFDIECEILLVWNSDKNQWEI